MQFAEGGSDDVENLQALCPNCHSVKTEMDRRVQRQQDEYETTALLYEDDDNNNNRSFKAPAKRSAPPLLGNKKQKPNINLGPVRMTQSQKQDSDDEEIGFADILVNDDEEDEEDDILTRVSKKAKTSPNDSPSNNNINSKNNRSMDASSQNQKSMRAPITSSFFGNHVAAARKISSPPNRLQPSQSQEIMNGYDKDESSSDEDLVLPRHMQDDEDEDSDDQAPDPRFEKSFIAPSSNNTKTKETKPSGKIHNTTFNNNGPNSNKSVKATKHRINPFEASLNEETQVLPVNTSDDKNDLSSDNNRSNYDDEDEMNGEVDNNNESQLRSDNDNVDDEGENDENNMSGNDNNGGDDNAEGDDEQSGDSDQDLFPSQSVKVVSTKTGEWTSIRYDRDLWKNLGTLIWHGFV